MVSVLTSAEGANQALLPTALETAMSPKKYTDVGEGVCITGTAVATVPLQSVGMSAFTVTLQKLKTSDPLAEP